MYDNSNDKPALVSLITEHWQPDPRYGQLKLSNGNFEGYRPPYSCTEGGCMPNLLFSVHLARRQGLQIHGMLNKQRVNLASRVSLLKSLYECDDREQQDAVKLMGEFNLPNYYEYWYLRSEEMMQGAPEPMELLGAYWSGFGFNIEVFASLLWRDIEAETEKDLDPLQIILSDTSQLNIENFYRVIPREIFQEWERVAGLSPITRTNNQWRGPFRYYKKSEDFDKNVASVGEAACKNLDSLKL